MVLISLFISGAHHVIQVMPLSNKASMVMIEHPTMNGLMMRS
jgi:hypothetical protein